MSNTTDLKYIRTTASAQSPRQQIPPSLHTHTPIVMADNQQPNPARIPLRRPASPGAPALPPVQLHDLPQAGLLPHPPRLKPSRLPGPVDNLTHGNANLQLIFCDECGVRVFMFQGESRVDEVDLAALGGVPRRIITPGVNPRPRRPTRVWRLVGQPDRGNRLSVNGQTVDAGQGFDMRELVERKQVLYTGCSSDDDPLVPRFERPHAGGCY
ncbi:hypothetical protein QQS21_006209 [Conoideocrella luteorostrata]|uniref:CENP-V/GFA domain-containing protein n=1 Tax=Conoideocrella luteorostrata TaxID=1105319 RepID=A0AAJ0CMZ2_9HYPO|nr:hypothetical protein QQS21_006209 [Conoideocrella luteorostrata]